MLSVYAGFGVVGRDGSRAACVVAVDADAGGLGRFDHERGEQDLWNNPNGQLASEPVFVPRPKAAHEGEGWVLSLILDGPSDKSFLGVFDAMNMAEGPKAKLWFNQRIPLTFHGQFVA